MFDLKKKIKFFFSFQLYTCAYIYRNVAEALVSKGFATVVRYRQDDDQRSSRYDELLAAEMKAVKTSNGVHDKKEAPTHRVADLAGVSLWLAFNFCYFFEIGDIFSY